MNTVLYCMQGYVRERLVQFGSEEGLALQLGQPQERVQQAVLAALNNIYGRISSMYGGDYSDLQLVFRHDCL